MADYIFKLDLNVYDPVELYQKAFTHAISVDMLTDVQAREFLLFPGTNDVNVHGCLSMLLDPGSLPGCGIYGHEVEECSDYAFSDTEGDGL
jgi:hypothetical protein